ncbi:ATP-binding cassette domain-containing protein [Endozoicomonas ascidiicola]|uniref:ATP-binding cassette domain-containing protein n=1 Tax=Endozoicomonas ascidiicola TaxID=1698521 RepID=UPI00083503A0|nr:ATP-binding cassette domain-containing protein [Endozoicomonas ascidiicola]
MNGDNCQINTASLINALDHLNRHYVLYSRLAFISNQLRETAEINIHKTKGYLEELGFLVKVSSISHLEMVELDEYHLLFCFDHEQDIIILRHDSDFNRTRGKQDLEQPILIISTEKLTPRAEKSGIRKRNMRWFIKRLTEKDGIYLILTGLITNLLAYVVPIYNMNVFDKVLPNGFTGILSSLVLIAVFLVLIWFVNRSALSYLLSDRVFRLEVQMAREFSYRLCNLKPSAMPKSSAFMTQLVTYGRSLSQMLGAFHLMALVDSPFMLLSLGLIAYFGGPMVFIPLVAILFVVALNLLLQPRIQRYINERYEFEGRKRKFEYEIMQSLPFIKLAGMERYFTDAIENDRPDHRQYFSISAHINHISMLVLFLSLIAVTGYGAWQVSEGMMTLGQLVACSLLSSKAITSASITNLLFNINRIRMLFDNLNQFYEIPVEERGASFCLTRIKHLELKQIEFTYAENRYFQLKGISFDLNLPESLYVYGHPGSGKTSLFNLLAGIEDPARGSLLVNNLNIEHFDYRDIRSHIHFSPSYYRFFSGSLYDNLILGNTMVTSDQIAMALDKVQLTDKINQIEDGLHYKVENHESIPLSSGERKRFMLARVFLTEADLVILDEPFEFMSDDNGLTFVQSVRAFCEESGKGLIILSNRKSFAQFCNQSLTLSNGQLYPMKLSNS